LRALLFSAESDKSSVSSGHRHINMWLHMRKHCERPRVLPSARQAMIRAQKATGTPRVHEVAIGTTSDLVKMVDPKAVSYVEPSPVSPALQNASSSVSGTTPASAAGFRPSLGSAALPSDKLALKSISETYTRSRCAHGIVLEGRVVDVL
jgi:hypothetical protein